MFWSNKVRQEKLVKQFGTSAMNYYADVECLNKFTKSLPLPEHDIESVWFYKAR
jgi:hypothetical protein